MKKWGTRRDDLAISALILISAGFLLPLSSLYFLMNDADWILRARAISLSPPLLFQLQEDGFYRPFLFLFFSLLYHFFGNQFFYYRLVILSLHLFNLLLLYYFFRLKGGEVFFAFLAALFFLLTPSHYQELFWFATVTHIAATAFGVLSLIGYERYASGKRGDAIPALLFFVMALTTREYMAALLLFFFIRKRDWLLLPMLLFFGFLLLLYRGAVGESVGLSLSSLLGMAADLVLSFFGFFESSIREFQGLALVSFFLLLLVPLWQAPLSKKAKEWLLYLLISLLPFGAGAFVGPLGFFHHYRYLYFPSFFFCGFLSALFEGQAWGRMRLVVSSTLIFLLHFGLYSRFRGIFFEYSSLSRSLTLQLLQLSASWRTENFALLSPPRSPFLVYGHSELLERNLSVVKPAHWRVFYLYKRGDLKQLPENLHTLFLRVENGQLKPLYLRKGGTFTYLPP